LVYNMNMSKSESTQHLTIANSIRQANSVDDLQSNLSSQPNGQRETIQMQPMRYVDQKLNNNKKSTTPPPPYGINKSKNSPPSPSRINPAYIYNEQQPKSPTSSAIYTGIGGRARSPASRVQAAYQYVQANQEFKARSQSRSQSRSRSPSIVRPNVNKNNNRKQFESNSFNNNGFINDNDNNINTNIKRSPSATHYNSNGPNNSVQRSPSMPRINPAYIYNDQSPQMNAQKTNQNNRNISKQFYNNNTNNRNRY
jgi:hypothetical protein